MRKPATVIALIAAVAFIVAGGAEARSKKNHSHRSYNYHRSYDDDRSQGGSETWNGTQSPWQFPNCIVWSPKIRSWVWVCSGPYPAEMPNIRALRQGK